MLQKKRLDIILKHKGVCVLFSTAFHFLSRIERWEKSIRVYFLKEKILNPEISVSEPIFLDFAEFLKQVELLSKKVDLT